MIGAIIGDIVGSRFERNAYLNKGAKPEIDFELFTDNCSFTDDTVLTLAIADAFLSERNFTDKVKSYGLKYFHVGYGGNFKKWLKQDSSEPYNSWGNGSAMRVSAVAYVGNNLDEVIKLAEETAKITHNHPEGIKGAQAIAAAIYLAKTGSNKQAIKQFITEQFQYNLDRKIKDIREYYVFDVSCQGSVPEAIIAFLEGTDFENTIRLAISIGGDTDTIACIAGSIAEAFYSEIPEAIVSKALSYLDEDLTLVLNEFRNQFYH